MIVLGYRLPGMSSLILWGLLWEAVGQSGLTFFLPPLSEVLATLYEIFGTPAFQKALSETATGISRRRVFCDRDRNSGGNSHGQEPADRRTAVTVGQHLSQRATDRPRPGPDGVVRFRHEVDHHHDRAVRDLDHHTECARRA